MFDRKTAIKILADEPRANVYFSTRDATGQWYQQVPVSLVEGELVQPHPTDPKRGSIAVPAEVTTFKRDGDVPVEPDDYEG